MSHVDAVVIGGGIAGATAALALADRGLAVTLADAGPGGTALWSGAGDLLGPTARPPAAQHPTRALRAVAPTHDRPVLDDHARLALLAAIAPRHPFLQLALDPSAIRAIARTAAERLTPDGALRLLDTPAAVITVDGIVRTADLPWSTVAPSTRGGEDVFVGLDAMSFVSPEWTARARIGARALRIALDDAPPLNSLHLASRWLAERPDRWERLAEALAPARGASRVWLPPILGHDPDRAFAHRQLLGQALDAEILELVAPWDSPHGLRLRARIDAAISTAGIPRAHRVNAVDASGDQVVVVTADGELRARALVLATGGRVGRGQRAPWIEAWLEDPPAPDRATADAPWQPQPFLQRGVPFGEGLRYAGTSDRRTLPIWVAGAALSGHDVAHDGTALGLALVSGRLAGNAAADAIGRAGG